MLRIRLMRMGRKRQPFYRVVVVPRQNKPGRGRYVEKLGWVDPLQHTKQINHERVQFWLSNGAQPSDTVWNLFVREGIVDAPKRKKGTTKSKKEEVSEEATEGSPDTTKESSGEESVAEPQSEKATEEPAKEEPKEDNPKEDKKESEEKPEATDPSNREGSPDKTEKPSGDEKKKEE